MSGNWQNLLKRLFLSAGKTVRMFSNDNNISGVFRDDCVANGNGNFPESDTSSGRKEVMRI